MDNNILGTRLLLEFAKAQGVGQFVYASTSSVYGDTDVLPMREDAVCRPFPPCGVSNLAGKHLCRRGRWLRRRLAAACQRRMLGWAHPLRDSRSGIVELRAMKNTDGSDLLGVPGEESLFGDVAVLIEGARRRSARS